MDRGAWWAAVHGIAQGRTGLSTHFDFSLSCIEEGNGNPLQCSCLENPRDGGAWWASIYGVAQSWTRLRRLSSSSSSSSSHQTAATAQNEPWRNSECENAGYWPQMTKVRIKRMISASLDSCIFPYIERQKSTKFLNFRYLLFFKLTTNLLVIRLPFFKTSVSPGSPPLLASLDRFY